ncbi:hypothetical protein FTUN_7326 [Frigoriglobus tundricola]|uniref:VIT family protein n=2 Tax=Frigoriglobus tundricola TaxID=2774151 RepID=A0A6M5Z2F3_9BACT|nr:hypothetical protein FTUN_7326 [Frigoriglobus tundricola]
MNQLYTFFDRYLEPAERLNEVLFGLIMVLIITLGAGALVAKGEDETEDLLKSVIGCNVAWGVIQGWMFVIDAVFERGRRARLFDAVRHDPDAERARAAVREEIDPDLEPFTSDEARAALARDTVRTVKGTEIESTRTTRDDLWGAVAVFILVSATTIPAVVPFLLIDNVRLALRVSNGLLLILLFLTGFRWAALTNINRWRFGFSVMLGGVVMVAIAEVLGG